MKLQDIHEFCFKSVKELMLNGPSKVTLTLLFRIGKKIYDFII